MAKKKVNSEEIIESDFLNFKDGKPFEYEGVVSGFGKLPSTMKKSVLILEAN